MNGDLRIRYSVSVDDMVAMNVHHSKHSPDVKRVNRRQTLLFLALPWVLAIVADLLGGKAHWTLLTIPWTIIFLVFTAVLQPIVVWLNARWMHSKAQDPGVICEHTIEIMDDGILETTDVNQNKHFWAGIDRIEESPKFSIIYTGPSYGYIIPKKRVIEGNYDSFMAEVRRRLAERSSSI